MSLFCKFTIHHIAHFNAVLVVAGHERNHVLGGLNIDTGKIIVVNVLVAPLGYWGIIVAEPITWIFMVIPLIVQYLRNMSPLYEDFIKKQK